MEDENKKNNSNSETLTTLTKKKYDQRQYNRTFMKKHHDMLSQKKTCIDCKGEYSYYNKSKHMKTKRHLKFVNSNATN
jgi:hypothetical protein